MTDILRQGIEWAGGMLLTHAASPITYSRGAQQVAISASIGKTPAVVSGDIGAEVIMGSRDYIVRAADLVLDSVTVEPEENDRITDGTETYEVHSPGHLGTGAIDDREPCYRGMGSSSLFLRIHTKRVSA